MGCIASVADFFPDNASHGRDVAPQRRFYESNKSLHVGLHLLIDFDLGDGLKRDDEPF